MRKTYLIICSMLVTACNSPNITYSGADLTNRSTVVGDIATVGAPPIASSSSDAADESFEAVAIDADHNDANKTITLSGTAVLDNINSYFTRQSPVSSLDRTSHNVMVSHISNPIVSLGFDEHGSIISTNLYVGDNHFAADNPSESNSRNFFQNFDDPHHGRVIIEVKRNFQEEPSDDDDDNNSFNLTNDNNYNDELWNFMANYMLNIRWVVGDSRHETHKLRDEDIYYDGYMIAGFETAGNAIDKDGEATFYGSGQGYYTSDKYTPSYAGIYFNTIAKVNFAARIVGLETVDTQFCFNQRVTFSFEWTCRPETQLNFTSDLRYDASKNNLSGTIELDDTMGSVEARFYGTDDNAAQELGGTFAIRNGYIRYTGSFGAQRTDVGNIFTVNSAPSVDISSYGSFQAISKDADADSDATNDDKAIILAGLAAQARIEKFYERPPLDTDDDGNELEAPPNWSERDHLIQEDFFVSTIHNPVISLTFNDDGNISGTSFYVGDNNYTASLTGTGSASSFSEDFDNIDSGSIGDIEISRIFNAGDSNHFNFRAQYMINIEWDVDDRSHPETHTTDLNIERNGYMIAGFETVVTDIPTEDTVEFSGNGVGSHQLNSSNPVETAFNVTADVDFSNRTVALQATDTAGYICFFGCSYQSRSQLDFTSNLSYDANTNNISGTVATNGMVGTTEARFYGTGDEPLEELGGTFVMRNGGQGVREYYYGYFGAFREHYIEPSFDDVSKIVLKGTDRAVEFSSLAVESSITADLKRPEAHKGKSWIYHTKLNEIKFSNPMIEETASSNPRINITYSRDDDTVTGLLDRAEVRLGNQTYRLDDGGLDVSTQILRKGILAEDNGFDTGYMEVGRGQEFGFESKYMVSARWGLISDITWVGGDEENINDITYQRERTEASAKFTSGFSISGFATGDADSVASRSLNFTETMMPIEGNASFTGKGVGYYYSDIFQLTEFDVTANVKFETRIADITTSKTMGYVCETIGTNCDDATRTSLDNLNISTGDISYTAGENNISKDDLMVDGMMGDINARFYGPATEEFGGTFHLQDTENDKYYMGYFGAQKQ